MTQFKNLVFEGGGVKGIAYVGVMEVLEQKSISPATIKRVGGTSAGAINALLFALGFDSKELKDIMKTMDFKSFMDDSFGFLRDAWRLFNEYGLHKGDSFKIWISELIEKKLGNKNATFSDLKNKGLPELFVYATDLNTGYARVYSYASSPDMPLAEAVRRSMSIPLFFAAVTDEKSKHIMVDGGVQNNYPIKLFDHPEYIENQAAKVETSYYADTDFVYNKETLGIRLDSGREIAAFKNHSEQSSDIKDFRQYLHALIGAVMNAQEFSHLHSDDWHRTIYVDTLKVKTTDFALGDDKKNALMESGRKAAKSYFDWFESAGDAKNKI